MRAVQRETKLPCIIVVGRLVARILLGVFSTHSVSYAQVTSGQGLTTEITGVRISADRRPVVTLKISDGQGRPLELSELDDGSIRFTVAAIRSEGNGQTSYHNYVLTKVAGKEYVYKGESKKPALAETLQPGFDNDGVETLTAFRVDELRGMAESAITGFPLCAAVILEGVVAVRSTSRRLHEPALHPSRDERWGRHGS